MSTEKLDTEIRQEQIIKAAMRLAETGGLQALNLANIARHVGLVPTALYRHFPNKEALLDALLSSIQTRLLENVSIVCRETEDPIERLRGLLYRHVRLIRENQGIPRIVFSPEFYTNGSQRKTKSYQGIRGYLERVGAIISEAQRDGRIRRDCPPETLSMMFLGIIQPAAFLWFLSDGEFDVTKHAERAWRIFSQAICCEEIHERCQPAAETVDH